MMGLSLSGHIGAVAADLVDGRLGADDEERAWKHVLSCPRCRQLVEAQGWAKRQLGSLRPADPYAVPADLIGVLHDIDDLEAWAPSRSSVTPPPARTLRRTSLALAGAGSVGAAVFGFAALSGISGPPVVGSDAPRVPASIRTGISQPMTPSSGLPGTNSTAELRRTSK